jgi:CBS domain-containing protein
MKVKEIMTPDVEVAKPDDTLQIAAKLMADTEVGVLPVCDGDRLVGMLTDRDITVRGVAEGKSADNCAVRELMSDPVRVAFEDDELIEVTRKMAEWQVRRLPVLNRDNKLVGIVSLSDIALEAALDTGTEKL